MRLILALVVACFVAACGLDGQSSAERAFVNGNSPARSTQAVLDAEAIMQGMEEARTADQRVARDTNRGTPETAPSAITR
ncbi:MAG TPA: hypothetical protein VMB73_15030 [Acetobacteraceae bacterium]|jgi:hypothetical protein|nr:hypothetical protein [Acetobacteraceae bacterium]